PVRQEGGGTGEGHGVREARDTLQYN
ncbi:hypothetical protein CCACVL1_02212, partial [Corchorus capsularis]